MAGVAYSDELFQKMLAHIADGKSLRKTCEIKGMASKTAFLEWVGKDPKLAAQYARALHARADSLFDDCIDIADEAKDKKGASVARVRIQARHHYAAKMNPRKYGDFVRNEITGREGGPLEVRSLTDAQLDAKLEKLLGLNGAGKNGTHSPARGEGAAERGEQAAEVFPR